MAGVCGNVRRQCADPTMTGAGSGMDWEPNTDSSGRDKREEQLYAMGYRPPLPQSAREEETATTTALGKRAGRVAPSLPNRRALQNSNGHAVALDITGILRCRESGSHVYFAELLRFQRRAASKEVQRRLHMWSEATSLTSGKVKGMDRRSRTTSVSMVQPCALGTAPRSTIAAAFNKCGLLASTQYVLPRTHSMLLIGLFSSPRLIAHISCYNAPVPMLRRSQSHTTMFPPVAHPFDLFFFRTTRTNPRRILQRRPHGEAHGLWERILHKIAAWAQAHALGRQLQPNAPAHCGFRFPRP